jgi:hypothetical protein
MADNGFAMNDVSEWAGGAPAVVTPAPAAAGPEAADAAGEEEADGISGMLHAIVADLEAHATALSGADVTNEDKGMKKKLLKLKEALEAQAEDVTALCEDYDKLHEGDEDEEEEEVETLGGDE